MNKTLSILRDYEKKTSHELIEELISRSRVPLMDSSYENRFLISIITVVLERRCVRG